jgi:hypothetical protein
MQCDVVTLMMHTRMCYPLALVGKREMYLRAEIAHPLQHMSNRFAPDLHYIAGNLNK